jgi:outer membrane receptor protein involved in Fe transport
MRRVELGSSLRRLLLGSLATGSLTTGSLTTGFLATGTWAAGSLAAGLLAAAATPAHAAGEKPIDLPAGPLERSLATLSAQTGDQLLFPPELVAGRSAPALSGRFTTEQALRRLLAAEAFEAHRTAPRLVVLKPRAAPGPRGGATGPSATRPAEAPDARPFGADAAGTPVAAAAPAAPAAPPAPATVAEVQVTGSHIRGGGLGPAPLVVLDREALERTGYGTIAGALSVLPQNFGGLNTEGTIATRADGQGNNNTYASSLNLRGLGSNATLVLVNGRRLGGSGISGDFTDVSGLPAVAVERVEVLLDGASAVYGSDAVGGVVNIILRRDLQGGEVQVSAGTGDGGAPHEAQAGAVFGHAWDTGNLLLAYETHRRTALAAEDRPWTASADLRPFGGSDRRLTNAFPGNIVAVDPATGLSAPYYGIPAGQDGRGLAPGSFRPGAVNRLSLQDGQDILPDQRRQSVYASIRQALTPDVELSADLRYSFRAARIVNAASVSTFTVTRANPFFVSPNGAASHQIQYSFAGELPNPVLRPTAENLAASLGGRAGLWGGWDTEAYLGFAQEIDEMHGAGIVNTAILAEALGNAADRPETAYAAARDGFFNPYTGIAANPPAVMAAIGSGFTTHRTRSRIATANLQADGDLFRLAGGPVKAALGLNARRETFRRSGTSYTSTPLPNPQSSVSGERTVAAAFAEVLAPLVGPDNARPGVAALELSGAVRVERYSDFGTSADPRVGLVWAPLRGVRLRGTYGTSFRAPSHTQLLAAQSITPLFLDDRGVRVLTLALQGGNPDLEPETATTLTLGVDYEPAWSPRSRLSVTWFDTDFKDRVSRPVNENVQGALADPRFTPFVRRVSPATNPADLALIQGLLASPDASAAAGLNPPTAYTAVVDLRSVNTGSLRVRGLDVQARHALPLLGGELTLTGDGAWLFDYAQALTPTAPAFERAGYATFPARFRGRLSADWRKGPLSGGVTLNHVSAFRTPEGDRIADRRTLDLRLRWTGRGGALDGTALSLSVRNLLDTAPPFYDNPFGFAYDPANADVVGRFVRVQLSRRW